MPRVAPNTTGFVQVENGIRQIYWEYFAGYVIGEIPWPITSMI
jgi:hypothetical protein